MAAAPDGIPSSSSTVYIGHQPILDRGGKLYAYELLFRSADVHGAGYMDGEVATSRVIYDALMEVGLDDIVGNQLAFINFPRDLIVSGVADLLPPSRVVIELLEDAEVDGELVASVRSLVEKGYKIALDDFVYSPSWDPLLELASIVKLDVAACSAAKVRQVKTSLERFGVEFLAEKVETQAEHAAFAAMGFAYYQGFYYARPATLKRERVPDNHMALLQLISRLQTADIEIGEVAHLVAQTVSLSHQLLRYINSALSGLRRKVNSIQEAVVYLGLKRLKDLASVMALSGMNGKSDELVATGLTRARTCELLAERAGLQCTEAFFLVGLFSILEALLDLPLEQVLGQLPVSDEVVAALLEHEGILGEALRASLLCERAQWSCLRFGHLEPTAIYAAHLEAMRLGHGPI
jgi:EAL and modified HD-GYP domain-containing signal transduction protein